MTTETKNHSHESAVFYNCTDKEAQAYADKNRCPEMGVHMCVENGRLRIKCFSTGDCSENMTAENRAIRHARCAELALTRVKLNGQRKVRNKIGEQLMRTLHECNLADVVNFYPGDENENDLPRGGSAQTGVFGYVAQSLIDLGFRAEYDFYCETGEVENAIELIRTNNCYLRVPKMFIDDHSDRDLPTPMIQRTSGNYHWIMRGDDDLQELIDDAKHYAETTDGWTEDSIRFVKAARRLLDALKIQGVE